jgi:hypothetical protein
MSNSISSAISAQNSLMSDINDQLINKRKRNNIQNNAIDQKRALVETRARMLQIAEENNIYKQKILFTLVALIFTFLIVMIFIYGYFSKK